MPTPKRIAAVSLALQKQAAQAMPKGVEVTILAPAQAEEFVFRPDLLARVNLALVHITSSRAFRIAAPRPGSGSAEATPPPLELQYVVTAYSTAGPAAEHSTERLLEAVLQRLHDNPVLTAADLNAALPDNGVSSNVSVELEPKTDLESRNLLASCGAKWRPTLVYRVRLAGGRAGE